MIQSRRSRGAGSRSYSSGRMRVLAPAPRPPHPRRASAAAAAGAASRPPPSAGSAARLARPRHGRAARTGQSALAAHRRALRRGLGARRLRARCTGCSPPPSQARISPAAFAPAYTTRRATATATLIGAGEPEDLGDGIVTVPMTVNTRIFGTVRGTRSCSGRQGRARGLGAQSRVPGHAARRASSSAPTRGPAARHDPSRATARRSRSGPAHARSSPLGPRGRRRSPGPMGQP